MKTISQIREQRIIYSGQQDSFDQMVSTGLIDESKATLARRALKLENNNLTNAEKNALRECFNSVVLEKTPALLAEKKDYLTKFDPRFGSKFPSDKDIPQILILKRKAIRIFPDNAKVALYYAQAIDKYISIPFGEIGVGSVNEQIEEELDMKYQSKKNIVEKVRSLRESNNNNVDSEVKQRFSQKLNESREQLDEALPLAIAGAAAKAASKAAPYIARFLAGKGASKAAQKVGDYGLKQGTKAGKISRIKSKVRKKQQTVKQRQQTGKRQAAAMKKARGGSTISRLAKGVGRFAAGAAGIKGAGGSGGSSTRQRPQGKDPSLQAKTGSSWEGRASAYDPLLRSATTAPGYLSQLRQNPQINQPQTGRMYEASEFSNINEPINLSFSDGDVTITPSIAKNIDRVYTSVNEENKKKIELMINESAQSLKKFINFASRY